MNFLGDSLTPGFFRRETWQVAQELLGNYLIRQFSDGKKLIGKIIETEAYGGKEDKASHARFYQRSKTPHLHRARLMFGQVGIAYVYQIYGMHFCLNVVAHAENEAGAVLIRALEPIADLAKYDCKGPARLTKAMQITKEQNGISMLQTSSSELLLVQASHKADNYRILHSTRVGIDYAGEHALLPWRFILQRAE